ncbi:rhamnogalacturonan acetylesterase [Flavobacterium sp. KACC 22761]|uniref:rhamnogalacturonan acetylesterase n=1 Tax=Flavobacterium sp. KACC 22761 TaxID=3092665 RepID=UPI002A74948B|nr:rhamnogalacturonan acetylesterase [Flavobacterium sp. KACC 22761]WPO78449.1 rhamnogalacturonan acetylesterase [Flavobacterium sp. KACC 22761]
MKSFKILSALFLAVLFFNFTSTKNNKPTVYMVGDSTVKNGKGDGAGGLWGWGDYIGQFLDTTKVNIENHALGGTSSRTFQDKGLWIEVLNKLKKGDYVLIQFGHNDDGPINDTIRARGTFKGIGNESQEIDNLITKKHETVHSYGWYIQKVVREAKSKGAIPIICSPIPRNDWKEGKVPRNDKSYGLWAKQIAEKEKVTFINLNEKMSVEMEKLGEANVTGTYFYKKDHTHTSAKGAVLSASVIINELKASKNSLKNYILPNPKIVLPPKKKLFLIGDSTMANNNNNPDAVGWGVPFPQYCDTTRIEVINKARGGRSTRTFVYEGLWDEVKNQLQPGNFVIIQFGHNDAGDIDKEKFRGSLKGNGDETQEVTRPDSSKEIVHTFGWYMVKFIREAKEKGAIPIVISLTPRNEWPNDKAERRTDTYVNWSKIAAEKENVPFIDLNDIVATKYEALGKEKVKPFFPKDHTHTGAEGATFNALSVAESLKKLKDCNLKDYIENVK